MYKILSLSVSSGNYVHIYHNDSSPDLAHHLVNLEKYNCCQFQRHIAHKTSKFILQDTRPPYRLRSESYDCENRKSNAAVLRRGFVMSTN